MTPQMIDLQKILRTGITSRKTIESCLFEIGFEN